MRISSSKMSTFPNDILLEIFRRVCARPYFKDVENDRRPGIMKLARISPTSPELILSGVCKNWRELMLSTTSFWTVICLGTDGHDVDEEPKPIPPEVIASQFKLLSLWKSRSGQQPLSVVLRLQGVTKFHAHCTTLSLMLIASVTSLSERCRFLSVRCEDLFMAAITRDIFKLYPTLEQLDLTQTGILLGTSAKLPLVTLPTTSPADLTKLNLRGGVALDARNIDRIGVNLTCFIYHQPLRTKSSTMSFNDAFMILARCPSLETFRFATSNDVLFKKVTPESPDWDNETRLLLLRTLTDLSFSSKKNLEFGPLLELLDAPKLKSLSLSGPCIGGGISIHSGIDLRRWSHNYVTEFLERSSSFESLLELNLEGLPLDTDSVVDCLDMLFCLEQLKLEGHIFDDYLVSRLVWIPGGSIEDGTNILPNLVNITVVGCSTTYVSVREVVHMVYSRVRYTSIFSTLKDEESQEKDNWVTVQQSKQWDEDSGPMGIEMIYLTDTKDRRDVIRCRTMQRQFFMNPIIQHHVWKGYIDIRVDDADDCFY